MLQDDNVLRKTPIQWVFLILFSKIKKSKKRKNEKKIFLMVFQFFGGLFSFFHQDPFSSWQAYASTHANILHQHLLKCIQLQVPLVAIRLCHPR
jgi:hypothetical protein